ncbi:MAG: hypothetical protein JWP10_1819 [Nocardioidaceae bacterium]|nr:hypothetical protein [Nocardioidaceae bacterium]
MLVKYEKPVWELMGDCALDLPRRFRFNHVRNWFDSHYPNIDDGTLRVHLIGLTETSNNASPFLATKTPLFRRVGHGQYEVIAKAEAEEPAARPTARMANPTAAPTPVTGAASKAPAKAPAAKAPASKAPAKPARISVSASPSNRRPVMPPIEAPGIETSTPAAVVSPVEPPSAAEVAPEPVEVLAEEAYVEDSDAEETYVEEFGNLDDIEEQEELAEAPMAPEWAQPVRRRPVDALFEPRMDATSKRAAVALGTTDVVLIAESTAQQTNNAAARTMYVSEDFERSRAYAESTGKPWFVMTTAHGLVAPTDWLSPSKAELLQTTSDYRSAWGVWVVAQLAQALDDVAGKSIEIIAPSEYVDSVRALFEARGALVTEPRLSEDDLGHGNNVFKLTNAEPTNDISDVIADVTSLLGNKLAPVPVRSLGKLPKKPGLYSWWVDEAGAQALSDGLGHKVSPGLIYAGQAGGTHWPSGTASSQTLRSRVGQQHLAGSVHDSVFRLSIASILRRPLRLRSTEDPRITEWMQDHLSVVVCAVDDVDNLNRIKLGMLDQLDPPLNLDQRESTGIRIMLRDMRRSAQP